MSTPAGANNVGGAVMRTLAELLKPVRSSMPRTVPEDFEWSKLTVMTWLVAGPPVDRVRTGIMSNSFQPVRGPLTQFVLPAFWPCSTVLNVAHAGLDPSNHIAETSIKAARGCFRRISLLNFIYVQISPRTV